ncbi:MAG: hypothetical protein HC843_13705 [Sphingomonadales bacterium]|nr:hypothetical protein [Sphingomonadales bacterium]
MFIAIPLTIWFIDISNRRGKAILTERHERGAMLVEAPILNEEVRAHNYQMFKLQCEEMTPPLSVNEAKALSSIDRASSTYTGPI